MKKTITFDLGGVLIDWNPRHLYRKIFLDQEEMEFFLRTVCSLEWNAKMDRGYPFKTAIAELITEHPQYKDQIKAYFDRWDEMISGSFPETVKILEELKGADYPLAGLSNWSGETLPRVIHQFEFLNWFDPLVLSGEVEMIKPEPGIYHYLLKEIKREPGDCVFIDDSEVNIRAAEELGIEGILFTSPKQLRDRFVQLGFLQN